MDTSHAENPESPAAHAGGGRRARLGLLLGPLLFAALLLLPVPAGLSPAGWRALAAGALMAVWWVTEAIPIPATALLPLALFPLLGVADIDAAAAPYANPIIFLFMGGFLLALAMQRWNLHRRIALSIVRMLGTRPASLVGGFMLATAFLSMWVSNTATAVMMLPIGISVVELVRRRDPGVDAEERNFAAALMLGIAYAASIGGFATLIGTPPNALLAGFMRETYGYQVGFAQWMGVGVPLMLLVLPLTWLLLVRLVFPIRAPEIPGGRELIERELRALGPLSRPEVAVAAVFTAAALLWIFSPLLEGMLPEDTLSDAGIGIAAALLLFLIPADRKAGTFVLDWEWAGRLPWDVLLLFGGGLSLADALTETGVAKWIGGSLGGLGALPTPLLILVVAATIIALSELASNTATAAAFLPVAGALALGIGESPLLLVVPAALAASCGFMLPVATPPNAIAYGTGQVTVAQMARAGAWLDLLCIVCILAVSYTAMLWAFGVQAGVVPAWAR
ncbi:MAG: DASS family sodium-coupled anion symporter [Gemmatimonadota bacterium]|nr:DASS family sodium-coupled anion symporter [Gemmatimonadota bacterium]